MPERQISLRFEDRCRRCGHALPAGTTARWNPDTKWVACIRCPATAASASAAATVASGPPPSPGRSPVRATGPQESRQVVPGDPGWRQLVGYHLLAVQRAGVAEPPPAHDRSAWTVLDLAREDVATGRGDTLRVDGRLRSLFADAAAGEAVYYGWPLLALADRSGRMRAAPLLVTELEPPGPDGPAVAVPRDDAPYLNPGLLTDAFFPPDALASADACLPDGLPFGDPQATRGRIVAVLEALGFDAAHLDPDRLTAPDPRRAGVHNAAVAFRGPSNQATRALIDELTELGERDDWRTTAARWLLQEPTAGTTAPDPQPGPAVSARLSATATTGEAVGLPPVAVEGLSLNDSQEQALSAAVTDQVTVVTGPPGTGKSQLVAAVVVNQWLAGRSVLVASTNNGAVDVAARRCATLDEALLVRTGNRELRDALPGLLERLAGRGTTPGPSRQVTHRQLEAGAAARHAVHTRLAERAAAEAELAQLILDLEALRTLLWGSPDPSPVHDQRAALHQRAARAARARWFRARHERKLLALAAPTAPGVTAADVAAWAAAETRADTLAAHLETLGPADPTRDRAELAAAADSWARAGTAALADTVQDRLHRGRAALQHLARLRAAARAARAAALARALPHAPGWACTTLSAGANFPLTAGLFDLLVIDEASQCAIADVLPLAYRARRILVVGDPNQLTPVVTLRPAALEAVAAAAGTSHARMRQQALSAGQDSAFTAYAARCPTSPHLLEEHYRCHPQIARFFNEQFYAGALRILTDVTTQTGAVRGLSLIDVPGRTQRGRDGGAYNPAEADAIVAWVLAHAAEPGILGVVTPFAAQATLIRSRLTAALGADALAARDIAVGTAHRFQGDERDIVLFSTVLATDARAGTARWVEDQRNLVNVAVSRARRALVVFADATTLAATPVPTLHALVDLATGKRQHDTAPEDMLTEVATLHSEAERRLFAALARRGHRPRLKTTVEGYELDFALDTPTGPVNIEVDGIHHTDARGRQRRQDLARDQVLENLGWRVLRIPAWRCLSHAEHAAAEVEAAAGVGNRTAIP